MSIESARCPTCGSPMPARHHGLSCPRCLLRLCLKDDDCGMPPDTPRESPGTIIGRYKLLQEIGEGGFGIVYLAEQSDPVKRMVALKVVKPGIDTREVVARFETERQALALMDHPNIAKVHDGGTTESGRPYFVMELVRAYWVFDLNIERKSARSNPADSQIKDNKAFAVGAVAPGATPEAEAATAPAMIPRPRNATAAQIDLSEYYNGSFRAGWLPTNAWSRMEDKNMIRLEPGISKMGETDFDIRGVVQVSSIRLMDTPDFPEKVAGIAIGAKAAQLHFVHACAWNAGPGTPIGHYLVRYADDSTEKIPLLYGRNIRDWVCNPRAPAEPALTDATEVWEDTNAYVAKEGAYLRIAKFTWKNPNPETEIRSIDLVSSMTQAAPFLMAITRESGGL